MVLRARFIAPLTGPPIENGAVWIESGRVRHVGPWDESQSRGSNLAVDLGEVVLLPGLVNAHCHLDYTNMAGLIAPPRYFPDWIKALLALKAHWSFTDYARSWINGARMLARSGVTVVGDIEAVPELLPDAWNASAPRVCSFFEMTGVASGRPPSEILGEALGHIARLPRTESRFGALSPHAPYSTNPELLRLSAESARDRELLLATHVGESEAEFAMFQDASGPLYDWLKKQRDMSDCGLGTPVAALRRAGLLGPNFLAVHANYLGPGDAALLAEAGAHVVHCPRSHDYFSHRAFPFEEMAAAGVNICLGTDSLVSVRRAPGEPLELDMFAEMRQFRRARPGVAPETILRMATVNGARALGLQGLAGELSPGSFADVIAVPFGGDAADLFESVIHARSPVSFAMVSGEEIPLPAPARPEYLDPRDQDA